MTFLSITLVPLNAVTACLVCFDSFPPRNFVGQLGPRVIDTTKSALFPTTA